MREGLHSSLFFISCAPKTQRNKLFFLVTQLAVAELSFQFKLSEFIVAIKPGWSSMAPFHQPEWPQLLLVLSSFILLPLLPQEKGRKGKWYHRTNQCFSLECLRHTYPKDNENKKWLVFLPPGIQVVREGWDVAGLGAWWGRARGLEGFEGICDSPQLLEFWIFIILSEERCTLASLPL